MVTGSGEGGYSPGGVEHEGRIVTRPYRDAGQFFAIHTVGRCTDSGECEAPQLKQSALQNQRAQTRLQSKRVSPRAIP
jgi:hypothetical protein